MTTMDGRRQPRNHILVVALKSYNLEDLVKDVPYGSGSRGCPSFRAGIFDALCNTRYIYKRMD